MIAVYYYLPFVLFPVAKGHLLVMPSGESISALSPAIQLSVRIAAERFSHTGTRLGRKISALRTT